MPREPGAVRHVTGAVIVALALGFVPLALVLLALSIAGEPWPRELFIAFVAVPALAGSLGWTLADPGNRFGQKSARPAIERSLTRRRKSVRAAIDRSLTRRRKGTRAAVDVGVLDFRGPILVVLLPVLGVAGGLEMLRRAPLTQVGGVLLISATVGAVLLVIRWFRRPVDEESFRRVFGARGPDGRVNRFFNRL